MGKAAALAAVLAATAALGCGAFRLRAPGFRAAAPGLPLRGSSSDGASQLDDFDRRLQGLEGSPSAGAPPYGAVQAPCAQAMQELWDESCAFARLSQQRPAPARLESRVSDAGTLTLSLAPYAKPRRRWLLALPGMAFSTVWFSAIGSFTLRALASRSAFGMIYSLPFWIAGATTTRQTLRSSKAATAASELSIGAYQWSLSDSTGPPRSGETPRLAGVFFDDGLWISAPEYPATYLPFAPDCQPSEQVWIATAVTHLLEGLAEMDEAERGGRGDLPAAGPGEE